MEKEPKDASIMDLQRIAKVVKMNRFTTVMVDTGVKLKMQQYVSQQAKTISVAKAR